MKENLQRFARNIPNIISGFRICLVIVFAAAFSKARYVHSLIVYLIAFVSDLLDGYLARRNNWISSVGKLLDPLADKLMLICVLVCFAVKKWIPLWLLAAVVVKELMMCIAGGVLYFKGVVVEADASGKTATGMWTLGVCITMLSIFIPQLSFFANCVLLCAVLISFLALVNYAMRYIFVNKNDTQEE